ncbi:hypothetical protein ACQRCL_07635 [Limosilactobacillus reuteri]|uniref:hypothetical protein n=1 Tax=Limosilactobacillus reuteri TaxID=1598 RepID=UPI003D05FCC1
MVTRKIFDGTDESLSRINNNLTNIHHQWDFEKSQTAHVDRRNQVEQLQKELQKERSWTIKRVNELSNNINDIMGSHWPHWANKRLSLWSDADFEDMKFQCQQRLQEIHPNVNITSTMVNQLATKVMSLVIQKDRMWQMTNNIKYWLEQDDNWRLKQKTRLQTISINLHDEDSTETTQAFSSTENNPFNRLRTFDEQVIKMSLQSQQRTKLQRYRIRTVIEKSLTAVQPTKVINNKSKHQDTNDLEL